MGLSWHDEHLFDLGPLPEVTVVAGSASDGEAGALSATQKRTIRNNMLLAAGTHPATRYPLLGGPLVKGPIQDGPTCSSCSHLLAQGHNLRTYYKCGLVLITGGPGTDIRISWPACTRWEQRP